MARILVLCRYDRLGASSRLRFLNFLPALGERGYTFTVAPLFDDAYIRGLYQGRRPGPGSVLRHYRRRLAALAAAAAHDLVWLEKELLPWFPGCLETAILPHRPLVVDYDDAWFHRYDGHRQPLVRLALGGKIDRIMRHATVVVAGSTYLADHARAAGARRVEVVPTGVDLARYPVHERPDGGPFVIGWIGTPATIGYLTGVQEVLRAVCPIRPTPPTRRSILRVIGVDGFALDGVAIDNRPWSEATEAIELAGIDAGIMPLPDSPFERGKCGYKLIQYMAAGRAAVASPVGANRAIVVPQETGLLARTTEDWIRALATLRDDPALCRQFGRAGRARVEGRFDCTVLVDRLAAIFASLSP